jgi:hypothetical protein
MEITVEDESENTIWINLVLIRADSPAEAYERSIEIGKQSEDIYPNNDGKTVTMRFRGLRDLNVIHEELEHGSELVYDEKTNLSEEQVKALLRPKESFAVFRDRDSDI